MIAAITLKAMPARSVVETSSKVTV